MIASIEITSELVPYIVIAVCAIFSLGYFIGHKIGRIDGETETARWYEGRRKRNNMQPAFGRNN